VPVELYAGSTARRWIRAFAGSADRMGLLGALGRGLWAGARAGPRPNETIVDITPSTSSPHSPPST